MNYSTIKELVIDTCTSEGSFPTYESLTQKVMQSFPKSKWKKTHYAWYKSKIKSGEIDVPGFDLNSSKDFELEEAEIESTVEASVSLERDLHRYLASNINDVERGLQIMEDGIEYQLDAGRIDILAKDLSGDVVVIELKAGKAKDSALGQLLGYMGCLSQSNEHEKIRGILVASDFDKRLVYAVQVLPQVKLIRYQISFHFEEIS